MLLTNQYLEIDSFLTQNDCDRLVTMIESKSIPGIIGKHFDKQYRIMFGDEPIQHLIQQKLSSHLPDLNVSVMFSYVKYENGGKIPCHYDVYNETDILFTMIIYLNDNYKNGKTYLLLNDKATIQKKTGKALIFMGSKIEHGCEKVIGTKKILAVKLYSK